MSGTILVMTGRDQLSLATVDVMGLLHSAFGFSSFRPNQEAVCRAAREGRDVLLVMPTGSGKSLCYQLPGFARSARAFSELLDRTIGKRTSNSARPASAPTAQINLF